MKALTVKQPWAGAIIHLGKDVENRSRPTNYRGPLFIHAGVAESKEARDWPAMRAAFKHHGIVPDDPMIGMPRGQVIGTVDVIDCHHADDCAKFSKTGTCSEWAMEDNYHWVLANPQPLALPFPMTGKLGIWNSGQHKPRQLSPSHTSSAQPTSSHSGQTRTQKCRPWVASTTDESQNRSGKGWASDGLPRMHLLPKPPMQRLRTLHPLRRPRRKLRERLPRLRGPHRCLIVSLPCLNPSRAPFEPALPPREGRSPRGCPLLRPRSGAKHDGLRSPGHGRNTLTSPNPSAGRPSQREPWKSANGSASRRWANAG